jgi:endonuclease/exonuclease/phosphatase (EEP) superfamily protein YafD
MPARKVSKEGRERPASSRSARAQARRRRRWIFHIVLASIVALNLALSFLPRVYQLDVANHFRPLLTVVSLVAILAAWLTWRRKAWLTALFAAGPVLTLFLWPSLDAALRGRGEIAGDRLAVVSFNLLGDNDSRAILSWLAATQPDVIAFQEVSSPWRQRILSSGLAGMSRIVSAPGDVEVLSLRPIRDGKEFSAPPRRSVAMGIVELSGRSICVVSIHPNTAITEKLWRARNLDLETASYWLLAQCPADAERIVMGDWNTTPWSGHFRRFLKTNGLIWANASLWPEATRLLPPPYEWLGSPIDHIAISPGLKAERCRLGPRAGSDHKPVVCEIGLREGARRRLP